MKKTFVVAAVAVTAVMVLAAVVAAATGQDKAAAPAKTAGTTATNPAKICKAERASIGVGPFADKYGTNPNKRNAFGKCVSKIAKAKSGGADEKDEKSEKGEKKESNAAKKCRTPENAAKIGVGKTWRNFGACVNAQHETS